MKTKIFKHITILLILAGSLSACSKKTKKEHDIFACGVNDPLQNIEWLRELCESLNDLQIISTISIKLYKVIGKDEHFFCTSVSDLNISPIGSSINWKNCNGETIIHMSLGVSSSPEAFERYNEFVKDKEFVAELFHFVKQ